MKQFLKNIQTRLQDFWECFRPTIVDFTIIGLLGFMIYWTRWRKQPIEKPTPATQQVDTANTDPMEDFFKQP